MTGDGHENILSLFGELRDLVASVLNHADAEHNELLEIKRLIGGADINDFIGALRPRVAREARDRGGEHPKWTPDEWKTRLTARLDLCADDLSSGRYDAAKGQCIAAAAMLFHFHESIGRMQTLALMISDPDKVCATCRRPKPLGGSGCARVGCPHEIPF